MTIYQATLASLTDDTLPVQRLFKTNRREALKAMKMLVREFGPKYGTFEAKVFATDSAGWMQFHSPIASV